MNFFQEHIQMLQKEGHTVELACNCNDFSNDNITKLQCKIHHIPFSRTVYNLNNIKSCYSLKKLMKEQRYDVVHTHTPIASAIVRFVCRPLRKKGLKIFYTAHGFHFYKGASLKSWLLFFPVEWLCSNWTDVLITINREDFKIARLFMNAKRTEYVPGVGIDLKKFSGQENERKSIRKELGIKPEEIMILSVGELNSNKNHEVIIRAIAGLKNESIHYLIAGQGELEGYLEILTRKLNLQEQIHLLGYRRDVIQLYKCVDIYVLPSLREGLNVSLMEAMASGLPIICSKIRGNNDLVLEGKGGILCRSNQVDDFIRAIEKLIRYKDMAKQMGKFNEVRIKQFESGKIVEKMKKIYMN